jgi:hypothetical protein
MYEIYQGATGAASAVCREFVGSLRVSRGALLCAVAALMLTAAPHASAQLPPYQSPVRRISDLSEKLELTTNASRILTLDKPIPRVQVNNPELLAVCPPRRFRSPPRKPA